MKIKTYKPKNTFPGDTFLKLDAHMPDGRIIPEWVFIKIGACGVMI